MTSASTPESMGSSTALRRSFFEDTTVPQASPAWYGSVMGSAILATLSELRTDVVPFGHGVAVVFWCVAACLLFVLTAAFAVRVLRDRAAFRATVATPVATAQWGMVAMGVLAFGSATSAVMPRLNTSLTSTAWHVDLGLWFIGTAIGLATALAVPTRLLLADPGTPTTVWGLAVVPPMVSATVGAGIAGWLTATDAKVWMLLASAGCFFVALVLGVILFAIAYRHHWLVESLPLAASITAWLPLGIVGQSTAAAQSIARQSAMLLRPEPARAVVRIAHVYGDVMLTFGLPLVAWAVVMTVRGLVRRMPYSPNWWGMTFPVGTLVLGSTMLGRSSDRGFITAVGGVLYVFLLCTWSICAVASVIALGHSRRSTAVS